MRILIILTLTVAAFAYGWMHQEINVSPNYSSTKHRPAFSTEGTELPDGQKLSSAKLNFVCDRRSDSLELVKFYNATGGQNWWKKWDLNKSMDTWWGIRLTSEGCILTIFLKDTIIGSCCSGNNLIGQVPTLNLPELNDLILGYSSNLGNFPNLESLPKLRNLFFYTTNFNGILIDFTNLSNLISCHIQNCGISGVIPNFSNLPKLEFLNLIDNKLIGEIPNFKNSPNLKELHLYDNLLSGNIPNFSNLPKLQQLSLGSNQISGNIPDFNKIPNLEFLHLWENNLSGNIPNFKYLPELRYLYLNENKLSGTIPNFEFCKKLSEIGIYENNIEGNLPNHINTNPLLTEYKLYGNKLTFSSFIQNLSQVIKLVNINNKTCQTCTFDTLIYAPQQKIYYDTSILISSNSTYTLDLLIDDTVTTSTYSWYKNGILYKTIKGSNKLPFTPFTIADAGTYTGKITNPLAPQLTLESWPIRLNAGPSLVCDRRSDSLELVKFYNATGGPNWTIKWDLNKAMNTWYGISLSAEGCVQKIDFKGISNNLSAVLIQLNLSQLTILNLSNNQLTGSTPNFDKLPSLQSLNLGSNQLSGSIPNFDKLPNLQSLDLHSNQLTGSIPNFDKLPDLQSLNLDVNQLIGSIPNFDKLPDLQSLGLNENQLTGSIPNFDKLPNLQGLALSRNQLIGSIPNLDKLPNLQGLDLHNNQLTGSIPNFDKLPDLQSLDLNRNQLAGSIPNFDKLPNLQYLGLDVNQLIGSIPNFDKLPNLRNLGLNENQLTGSIPNFDKLPNLQYLTLSGNQLTGSIPNFDKLPSLQFLNLGYNQLTGLIPNFDKLPSLKSLHLSGNRLIGSIPNYDKLPNLESLGLFENQLSGYLPDHTLTNPKLDGYRIDQNKLTFSSFIRNIKKVKTLTDVLNNLCPTCSGDTLTYAPQKMIYVDTSIFIPVNTRYTLDLLIDDTVTTSTYAWYKNGVPYKTIKGSNKLPFTPFTSANAGTYTVKITNPLAPQLTLESWPIRLNAGPSLVCDRRSDSLELVKFYNATGGANWWKKWDLKKPINTWFGVKQSQDGCITGIYLGDTSSLDLQISGNNLSGTMIDLNLPHLLELNLASNKLEGNIPNFNGFPSLTSIILFNNKLNGLIPDFDNFPLLLDLNLGENRLSGNIPSLNKLTKLRNISLFSNILSGPLPAFDKALSLESIQIQSNKLDGSLPSLKNPILRLIYLHHNNFSGPIPSFDFTPNLETLNITDNYLTGTIPDFQRLPLLKVLALHNNLLSGSLPGLKSCLLLENYEVSVNQLDGLIPDLSHLKNLGTLTLSDNNFSGPLPKLDKFPGLKEVWLANNNFTGSLEDYTISNPLLRRGTFEGNKLTFSNIIKYHDKIKTLIEVTNKWSQSLFSYAPQQKIYVDTAITIPAYSNYPLDLKIDDTVTTSIYTWFKNDTVYKIITGKNKLLFSPFKPEDAGIYTVKITNPKAPQLILESRKINLMVGPQNGCNRFADSLELRRFYDSTGGNMWQNKTNWISVAPINTWNGIKLNTEGCVLDIRLDQNKLSGTLIDLNLQGLSTLYLPENNISGNLPSFKYLKNLTDLTLNHNMFTGSFPNIDSLKDLVVLGVLDNKLSGPLPILNNNKKIKDLNWGHNNFKGLFPDNSVLHPSLISNTIDDNKLTFEHLIQNLLKVQRHIENNGGFNRFVYAPQQKIYVDTTISIPSCTDYTLDLKIDDTVTSSTYSWFKDGVPFISIKGSNKLPFIGFNSTNTGTYTVKITNPLAPQLTLESPPIRLISSGTAPQINNPRDTALSCGSSYILPTLKGINLTGNGLYFSGPGKSGMSYKPGDKIISTTTLYAFDGSGSCFDEDTFTISFSIKPAFILKPDQYKVPYNQSILFDVLANDIIPPGLNVMVVIDNPVHGKSFYSQTSGKGTYTPDLGFIGKEILKYKVCPVSCPNVCDSSTVEFDVLPPCSDRNSLVLPNVIFPEGPSNDNRYFIVQALIDCPDDYGQKPTKLTVFNRWGDLVYRNTEYKNDWDGTNTQGLPLPSGTYYYLLDLGSVSAPIKGYVVIMR